MWKQARKHFQIACCTSQSWCAAKRRVQLVMICTFAMTGFTRLQMATVGLSRCQNLQFWTWTSDCWICHPKGRLLFNWDSAEDMKEMMLMNYPPISAILSVPFACHLERTELVSHFCHLLVICKSVARKPSHGLPRSTKGFKITNRRWHLVLPNEQLSMVKFGAPTTLTYPNQNLHPTCTNFCP